MNGNIWQSGFLLLHLILTPGRVESVAPALFLFPLIYPRLNTRPWTTLKTFRKKGRNQFYRTGTVHIFRIFKPFAIWSFEVKLRLKPPWKTAETVVAMKLKLSAFVGFPVRSVCKQGKLPCNFLKHAWHEWAEITRNSKLQAGSFHSFLDLWHPIILVARRIFLRGIGSRCEMKRPIYQLK